MSARVLTVSAIKPTFGSAINAGPSGSYTRYSRPRVADGRVAAPTTASLPRELAVPTQS